MNREQILKKWNQLKDSAHVEWPKLSDEDLKKVAGEQDRLIDLVQEKYERTPKEAEEEVKNWARRAG